ncbi:MAG: penicillin-binding protein activator [Proteobacteria bacterium]|nr:penicillin-binding protein activator [Pseudomonadota bacterium]
MVVSFHRSLLLPRLPVRVRLMASLLAILVLLSACQHRRVLSNTPPLETTAPPAPVATAPPPEIIAPPAPEPTPAPPPEPVIVEAPPVEPIAPPPPVIPEEPIVPALVELPPGPVSVALLLPLTGPSADLGQALFEAAQLALFDVGNEDFVLLPRDTLGTPEGAAIAANQALADGARLVIGPLFSGSVAAVAPITQLAGVNVVAFSSDRSVARPGVYLMGFLPGQQVVRVVEYAITRGLKWFTALAPSNAYGQSMVAALTRATQAAGAVMVDPLFFSCQDPSAHEQ